eukprot:scaffold7909_cov36-Tisochrysis_lutea.AAC.7
MDGHADPSNNVVRARVKREIGRGCCRCSRCLLLSTPPLCWSLHISLTFSLLTPYPASPYTRRHIQESEKRECEREGEGTDHREAGRKKRDPQGRKIEERGREEKLTPARRVSLPPSLPSPAALPPPLTHPRSVRPARVTRSDSALPSPSPRSNGRHSHQGRHQRHAG